MEKNRARPRLRNSAKALWIVACIGVAAVSSIWAGDATPKVKQEAKKKAGGRSFGISKTEPITITSDRMEVDRKKNTITYIGQVVAVQGEMTMKSDTLTAYYTEELKQMREVVAEGKVHIDQGDRVATGAKAVYDGQKQTFTLTGNASVRQGNSEVAGSRIVFFIEEDRAVAEGGNSRVKAKIFPEELRGQEKEDGRTGKAP